MNNIPFFFSESTKKYLQGTSAVVFLDEEINNYRQDYNTLVKHFPKKMEKVPFNRFMYYVKIVHSRIFTVSDKRDIGMTMGPIIDMFNHDKEENASWTV